MVFIRVFLRHLATESPQVYYCRLVIGNCEVNLERKPTAISLQATVASEREYSESVRLVPAMMGDCERS